jgi:hypothetical protein
MHALSNTQRGRLPTLPQSRQHFKRPLRIEQQAKQRHANGFAEQQAAQWVTKVPEPLSMISPKAAVSTLQHTDGKEVIVLDHEFLKALISLAGRKETVAIFKQIRDVG